MTQTLTPSLWSLSARVAYRNWAVYRKNFISNVSPTIVDPFMVLLAFGFGVGHRVAGIGDLSYVQYMVPGLIAGTAMFTAFFETTYSFYVKHTFEGVTRAMLTTPIGAREIVLGEYIWVAAKGVMMTTIMAAIFAMMGLLKLQLAYLLPLVGVTLAVASAGVGFIATSIVKDINQFQSVFSFFVGPIYYFSGAFYPVEEMPAVLAALTMASPFYHGVKVCQSLLWMKDLDRAFMVHYPILLAMALGLAWYGYRRIFPKLYR